MASVNTNFGAQIALQSLNKTNSELATVQERISTGLKVGSAKDDGAAYAIAQNLRAQHSALDAVTDSLNRGRSTVDLAVAAGESISTLLTDAKKLVANASDKSLDAASRQAYQDQYQAKFSQIRTQIQNASLNGVNLLDGSTASVSSLANASGSSSISVAAQNLSTATGSTGGVAATDSIHTGSAGPASAAGVVTISQASSFTVNSQVSNGGAAISFNVNLAAGGYTNTQIAAAINSAYSAAGGTTNGGVIVTATGTNQLTVNTSAATGNVDIAFVAGSGDVGSTANLRSLLGITAGDDADLAFAAAAANVQGSNAVATASGVKGVGVSQATTFTGLSDTGKSFTVSLAAGYYSEAQLSTAINNGWSAAGLAGTASTVNNGKLTLTGVQSAGWGSASGDVTSTATVRSLLGTTAVTGVTNYVAATAFSNTGGGGNIVVTGNESFTKTTNYADLITKLDASISNVQSSLGKLGVGQNTLDSHKNFVSKLQDTLTNSIGNLVDADLAKESARLQALQTKQQLGAQALSIANQAPQVLLSLFR